MADFNPKNIVQLIYVCCLGTQSKLCIDTLFQGDFRHSFVCSRDPKDGVHTRIKAKYNGIKSPRLVDSAQVSQQVTKVLLVLI